MYSKGATVRAKRKTALFDDPEIRNVTGSVPAGTIGIVKLERAFRGHTIVNFKGHGSGWVPLQNLEKAPSQ
jgi:hypothetical protein